MKLFAAWYIYIFSWVGQICEIKCLQSAVHVKFGGGFVTIEFVISKQGRCERQATVLYTLMLWNTNGEQSMSLSSLYILSISQSNKLIGVEWPNVFSTVDQILKMYIFATTLITSLQVKKKNWHSPWMCRFPVCENYLTKMSGVFKMWKLQAVSFSWSTVFIRTVSL